MRKKKRNFAYFKYLIIYTFMSWKKCISSYNNFMKFSTIYMHLGFPMLWQIKGRQTDKKKLIQIFVDIIRIIYSRCRIIINFVSNFYDFILSPFSLHKRSLILLERINLKSVSFCYRDKIRDFLGSISKSLIEKRGFW